MGNEYPQKELFQLTDLVKRGIGPKYIETGGVLVVNQRCIRDQKV
jgi:type I restriction enzyme, S subunit